MSTSRKVNPRPERVINNECDQLAVDLWDSNPLLTKEKQLTKLMVLLSDSAPNRVRTSLHQSVRQVACRKVGSLLKDWIDRVAAIRHPASEGEADQRKRTAWDRQL